MCMQLVLSLQPKAKILDLLMSQNSILHGILPDMKQISEIIWLNTRWWLITSNVKDKLAKPAVSLNVLHMVKDNIE